MKRRTFFLVMATILGGGGCRRGQDQDVITDVARSKLHEKETHISLEEYPTLQKEGNAVQLPEDSQRPPMLAIREKEEIRVFLSLCTHAACPLLYDGVRKQIVCNPDCGHGSLFGLDGSVLRGPATRPLFRFPATLEEGTLKVRFRLKG